MKFQITVVVVIIIIIKLVGRTKYDIMSLAPTGGRSLVAAPQSGLLAN